MGIRALCAQAGFGRWAGAQIRHAVAAGEAQLVCTVSLGAAVNGLKVPFGTVSVLKVPFRESFVAPTRRSPQVPSG